MVGYPVQLRFFPFPIPTVQTSFLRTRVSLATADVLTTMRGLSSLATVLWLARCSALG